MVDTAIIDMLTNLSWSESHDALMDTWFPKGQANAPFTGDFLDVPTFAAACALVGTTLVIAGVQLALEQRHIFARAAKGALGAVPGADFSGSSANPLKTGAARIEAAAAAAAGARDAARAAAAAAAAAEALATEVEQLAAALDAADGKEAGPATQEEKTPRSPRIIGALELDI